MESDKLSRKEIVDLYKPEIDKLIPYIPWLEAQRGKQVANAYKGNNLENTSIVFPVYDSKLMNFVKTAKATRLMNRNYVYAYSKYHIRTVQDEKRFIEKADLQSLGDLSCILSKYVLKGMTKATLWAEGVRNGIFLEILVKMREIILFWDKSAE